MHDTQDAVKDKRAILRELPPGQAIELRVVAANSADEAPPSAIVMVTVV